MTPINRISLTDEDLAVLRRALHLYVLARDDPHALHGWAWEEDARLAVRLLRRVTNPRPGGVVRMLRGRRS